MATELNIPNFELGEEIGRGGMARVYLAQQLQPRRKVAVKVVSPDIGNDPTFLQSLKQEGDTVAQFSHNNIVTVYACGVIDKHYYLAMEILDGGDLKSRIRSGLSVDESLTILKQMAGALEHAHGHNTLHRDIKPENILFHQNGKSVLVDFGIAKDQDSESNFTKAGAIVGTPHYMAPERSQGKEVDQRSDIYALGAVFYEMLTGRKLYLGTDTFAISYAHIYEPIPALPPELSQFQPLLEKMVAKEPADRFQTATELLTAIDEAERSPRPATPAPKLTEETVVLDEPLTAANAPKVQTEVSASGDEPIAAGSGKGLVVAGAVTALLVAGAIIVWTMSDNAPARPAGAAASILSPDQRIEMGKKLDAAKSFERLQKYEDAENLYYLVLTELDCTDREARTGLKMLNPERHAELIAQCDG